MRSFLISSAPLMAFASVLAVESDASLIFEKKGQVWHHKNEPFSDCRKVNRSALCKDIKSKAKPDKIGLFSIDAVWCLATLKSSNVLISEFGSVNPNVAEALRCARTLSNLTDTSAMNTYLDANPSDEHELLKYAYWLEWGHFKEFVTEMDRELDFKSLTLALDAEDSTVEIPTSSCSKRDLFFLIGLKSATDLERKLVKFDAQQQLEIFNCANFTNWVHFEAFIHEHKFIVNYCPDSIFSMILSSDDPKTTKFRDPTIKYRDIKEIVAKRNLSTIEKIADFYQNNKKLMFLLFPFVSHEFVVDLGTCTDEFVSSFCIAHHDKSLCSQILVGLVEETKCSFRINIIDSRHLYDVLGSHFLTFLSRSQIKIGSHLRDPDGFFDNALNLTVPIVIDEFTELVGERAPLLKYIQRESTNLSDFLRAIKIKELYIWMHKLHDIVREQIEILSVVSTILVELDEKDLVSNEFQKSLQTIKYKYPQILIKLGCIRIYGKMDKNSVYKFIEGLKLFNGIKVVLINTSACRKTKLETSAQMIKGLAQIHPKVDALQILDTTFTLYDAPPQFFHAFPEFKQLKLGIDSHMGPNCKVFLERVAPRLTQLEIIFYFGVKSIPEDIPKAWPLVTDLTVYCFYTAFYSEVCEARTAIVTSLRLPKLKTVTVIGSFMEWSDCRVMTKEEYFSMQCRQIEQRN